MNSRDARSKLVEALQLDLIGPDNDHECASELLPESPSKWYLTGYLMATDAPEEHRHDPESSDDVGEASLPIEAGGGDEDTQPADTANSKSYLPSSIGLSVLVPDEMPQIQATARWGDYRWESEEEEIPDEPAGDEEHGYAAARERKVSKGYRRESREESRQIDIKALEDGVPKRLSLPNTGGLEVVVIKRSLGNCEALGLPKGACTVSAFLTNYREPDPRLRYKGCAFQAELELSSHLSFLNQPDLRGLSNIQNQDPDERLADLQYRNMREHGIGHGIATESLENAAGDCLRVKTTWIPHHEVERVEAAAIPTVEFDMDQLAELDSPSQIREKLTPLTTQYRSWIAEQEQSISDLSSSRKETAQAALNRAKRSAERIDAGVETLIESANALTAFKIANRAISSALKKKPNWKGSPRWHPFQLAFILQNLEGLVDERSEEREVVDLLFFPTGGGKTEAYLGLAAFTMVLRRLRNPAMTSGGLSVLMRYTLRLLTLDQLDRAAALICALELERRENKSLGAWPFEIGLWVGSAATPNRIGGKNYKGPGKKYSAFQKLQEYQSRATNSPPIPLEKCPWCGTKFEPQCFQLTPNREHPKNLVVQCASRKCEFGKRDSPLPILSVDDAIYRRLPAFMIATVDKFASLPWEGKAGALLGHVNRHDSEGFYGACEPSKGHAFDGPLPAPDLIIQDELHLISGPLGTIAGVYEAAIEHLSSREKDGKVIKPKIIASTATVRRAKEQIQALFNRGDTSIFPPQGPNVRDSFFAKTLPIAESNGRLYLGIAAQGRSLKVILMRAALVVLCAGEKLYLDEGGDENEENPLDPYMTIMGYFNSLRELGGSRRIIEDEVVSRAQKYGTRKRRDPKIELFKNRKVAYEPEELTSRRSTAQVSETKNKLTHRFSERSKQIRPVDVALATNMISVGLDITRLGLMVVLGQPKGTAEYIQATSRVGRDKGRPGLVVSLFNVHKPRDRSHYEHFVAYHKCFYRAVEASSVTPFSPRALDRALAAALVSISRHSIPAMTPSNGANLIGQHRSELQQVAIYLAERASEHADGNNQELYDKVLQLCSGILDTWSDIQNDRQKRGVELHYQTEDRTSAISKDRLLYDFLEHGLTIEEEKFRANRSMRDVEPNVLLTVDKLNEPLS